VRAHQPTDPRKPQDLPKGRAAESCVTHHQRLPLAVTDDLDAVGIDPSKIKVIDSKSLCQVFRSVAIERARQDEKWGRQVHGYGTWKAVLGEEEGEADREFLRLKFTAKNRGAAFRAELVQAAAVLVAMIECGDRMLWFADRPETRPYQRTGEETI